MLVDHALARGFGPLFGFLFRGERLDFGLGVRRLGLGFGVRRLARNALGVADTIAHPGGDLHFQPGRRFGIVGGRRVATLLGAHLGAVLGLLAGLLDTRRLGLVHRGLQLLGSRLHVRFTRGALGLGQHLAGLGIDAGAQLFLGLLDGLAPGARRFLADPPRRAGNGWDGPADRGAGNDASRDIAHLLLDALVRISFAGRIGRRGDAAAARAAGEALDPIGENSRRPRARLSRRP